jgi:modulator of FtsH protease HflC
MRTFLTGLLLIAAVAGAIVVFFSGFIVDQTHKALVLQFGEKVKQIDEPGLYWRWPFVQTVVQLDRRILDLETGEQEVIASDQKRLVVDAYARYRILDPWEFNQTFPGGETIARLRLTAIIDSTIRNVLGRAAFMDIVRNKREALMKETVALVNNEVRNFGVEMVDVRIRRADLPEANSQAIYKRMRAEREREATELRAQGKEEALRLTSTADKEVTVLRANANRDSERIRGDGDEERNRIYAEAFSKDKDFFAFYRTMQAYEEALKGTHTRIVLSPTSEFFRYFNAPMGEGAGAKEPQPGKGSAAGMAPVAAGAAPPH